MRTAGVTAVSHHSIPNMKNPLFGKSLSNPLPQRGDQRGAVDHPLSAGNTPPAVAVHPGECGEPGLCLWPCRMRPFASPAPSP
jgi:hypothetical protein